MAYSRFSIKQADSKFFRQQAEKCADLARRTYDEDGRERWKQLQRTYCHLAEMEEQQTGKLHASPFLGWSARELASRCGVSHSAIARAEKADSKLSMQERNLNLILIALENHGIEFLGDNGVRMTGTKRSSG